MTFYFIFFIWPCVAEGEIIGKLGLPTDIQINSRYFLSFPLPGGTVNVLHLAAYSI